MTNINMESYGYDKNMNSGYDGIPARITATHRERFEVVCENGICSAKVKSSEYYNGDEPFPTTGDFVMIDYQPDGDSRITKTLPRKTCFSRLDPSSSGYHSQLVAANFDYVFIMQSLNHDFNVNRLERYLTLAWQSGAVPVIILTKADLVDDYSSQVRQIDEIAFGVDIAVVSAVTGFGIDSLEKYLKPGKTIVFLGSSGIGKSSLVNALAGEELMCVNSIREDDSKGRHTTTHRQLLMMKNGTIVIDTPGMRELGMWDVTDGIGQSFSDVEEYLGKCKFSDCHHGNEPGCAIRAAIKSGEISQKRWDDYLKLKNEARYSDDKEGYLRDRKEWGKSISKFGREIKKRKNGKL